MSIGDKVFYNKSSSERLGWEPSWFGAKDFDETLVKNIRKFQRSCELTVDGLCGPMTYRRIKTEREYTQEMKDYPDGNFIVCDGEKVPINWDAINILDKNSYALPDNCYRTYKPKKRKISMIVTHWDVCLSAKSCHRVLKRKGISSHFVIDNDGTICQMVDTQHEAWHAGTRKVNKVSVGIDFSNGYYTKYNKYYRRKGFGPRPILREVPVHTTVLKEFLGYYPVQIQAYEALLKCLHKHYNIPLECPLDDTGALLTKVHPLARQGKFKGVVNHYHLTNRKIDCAGLKVDKILQRVRDSIEFED
jgi:hypothetical protein